MVASQGSLFKLVIFNMRDGGTERETERQKEIERERETVKGHNRQKFALAG